MARKHGHDLFAATRGVGVGVYMSPVHTEGAHTLKIVTDNSNRVTGDSYTCTP